MADIGYTMMCEQAGPRELVGDVRLAEEAGFDFSVISDHYFPWLAEQGHSPYAWSVLGAAAQATERIPLMTYVTCPTMRYHPAVVAQKAATVQLLAEGRFTLGLGSGENLNEHVVGAGWPGVAKRHAMLDEAVRIIRALFSGEYVTFHGEYFTVEDAKLWDVPDQAPPLGIAVSGRSSCRIAGRHADLLIAVEPKAELPHMFEEEGGGGKPCVGQLPVCYDEDEAAARRRAHEQFRCFAGGWKVNSELPGPVSFQAASAPVREEDVAAAEKRVRAWADARDEPNAKYRDAHVWYDREHKGNFTAYKLLIADVVEGRLVAVPRGVMAAAAVMEGSRGGVDLPREDIGRAKNHLAKYYRKMNETPRWERD